MPRTRKGLVCFVLEPATPMNGEREHENNLVFEEIIEPAVDGHQFRITRSSDLRRGDYVTREHQRLATDEALVIINLSHRDPTVFFGLAARMAARPDLPYLLLLRQDQNCKIEVPVLRQKVVFYDVIPDTAENGERLSEQAETESVRRKLHMARRDLTTMVENLLEDEQYAPVFYEDAPPPAAGALAIGGGSPQAGPPPQPSSAELVDSLVRCLMQQAGCRDQPANLGTLGNITSGLFRSMQDWPGSRG